MDFSVSTIYILGIGGTFMGSLAQLAKSRGFQVFGCDQQLYSPMREQLQAANIDYQTGFTVANLPSAIDLFVIGNVVSRGNPLVEYILDNKLPMMSGPQFLRRYILATKCVLAVSGTHGKTSTSSMLAWILEYCGYNPSFLIGGVPNNFDKSGRLTTSDYFVIEADEYDTAFFDKRSKFVHYQPDVLIINNLEFDHSDIFADLTAIQYQFHLLMRTLPSKSQIFYRQSQAISKIFEMGCWSQTQRLPKVDKSNNHWQFQDLSDNTQSTLPTKEHYNSCNAVAAIYAAKSIGITTQQALKALQHFKGVKRRLDLLWQSKINQCDVQIYEDFAHHPTAIDACLTAAKNRWVNYRVIAVVDLASNSMQSGQFAAQLQGCTASADGCYWYQSHSIQFDISQFVNGDNQHIYLHIDLLMKQLIDDLSKVETPTIVLILSNGFFEGFSQKLIPKIANLV